jgi:aminoglycoside phosphotransferase (APT) family kinase protein
MKTPLLNGEALISRLLQQHWHLRTTAIRHIPIGDSAHSYSLETSAGAKYYLKLVDRRSKVGQRIAAHMAFSLPLQQLVAESQLSEVTAPRPIPTLEGALSVSHNTFLLALYEFVEGETLADAYPMSPELVKRIASALAALHTIEIPERQKSPQDSLTAPFEADLLANLASLEFIFAQDAPYLQRLRALVWPRREQIKEFLQESQEYANKTRSLSSPHVVCHGDAWGGNMILSPDGRLALLDWESAVLAPRERDAFGYMGFIGPDFAVFDAGYRMVHQGPLRWHPELLAYYAYRLQLRNLAQWLHNLLYESLNEVQRANDLEMIEHHCLDRLESVRRAAKRIFEFLREGEKGRKV